MSSEQLVLPPDQRLGEPEPAWAQRGFVVMRRLMERRVALQECSEPELTQLKFLSAGMSAEQVAELLPELGEAVALSRIRRSTQAKLGALTYPQVVYLAANDGRVPYDRLEEGAFDELAPELKDVLALAALGCDGHKSADILGVSRHIVFNRNVRICDIWGLDAKLPMPRAVLRAFELGIWEPHPLPLVSDAYPS